MSETPAPRVECTWLDANMSASESSAHWQEGDPEPPNPTVCHTVGYLTHVTPAMIKIVQTLAVCGHGNYVEIPLGMIQEIKMLDDSDAPVPGMKKPRARKRPAP